MPPLGDQGAAQGLTAGAADGGLITNIVIFSILGLTVAGLLIWHLYRRRPRGSKESDQYDTGDLEEATTRNVNDEPPLRVAADSGAVTLSPMSADLSDVEVEDDDEENDEMEQILLNPDYRPMEDDEMEQTLLNPDYRPPIANMGASFEATSNALEPSPAESTPTGAEPSSAPAPAAAELPLVVNSDTPACDEAPAPSAVPAPEPAPPLSTSFPRLHPGNTISSAQVPLDFGYEEVAGDAVTRMQAAVRAKRARSSVAMRRDLAAAITAARDTGIATGAGWQRVRDVMWL